MEKYKEENYQKCIEASSACAVACLKCAKILKKEQITEQIEGLVDLLFACAAVCLLNLKSLASESEFMMEACNSCEEICMKCEVECGKYLQFECCESTAIACGSCAMECKIITEM
jgi:hypothetical protein